MTYGQPGPPPPPPYYQQPPKSEGKGCFFYGCISLIVLFVVGGLALFIGARALVKHMVNTYTEPTAVELPTVKMSNEEIQAVQDRWEGFKTAVDKGEPSEPLVLTADDLNALIQNDKAWGEQKGKVYVSKIDDDKVEAEVSIPLDAVPFCKGRYFNGKGELQVTLTNGYLSVVLASAEIKGKPLGKEIMDALKNTNFAQEIYKDPQAMQRLSRIESIKLEDGKVVVVKAEGSDAAITPDAENETDGVEMKSFEEKPEGSAPAEEAPKEESAAEPEPAAAPPAEEPAAKKTKK